MLNEFNGSWSEDGASYILAVRFRTANAKGSLAGCRQERRPSWSGGATMAKPGKHPESRSCHADPARQRDPGDERDTNVKMNERGVRHPATSSGDFFRFWSRDAFWKFVTVSCLHVLM